MTESRSSAHTASILTAEEETHTHTARWTQTLEKHKYDTWSIFFPPCRCWTRSLCPNQMTKLAACQTFIRSGSYHSAGWQQGCCGPISLDFQNKLDKHIRGWQSRYCPVHWSDYTQWQDARRSRRVQSGWLKRRLDKISLILSLWWGESSLNFKPLFKI